MQRIKLKKSCVHFRKFYFSCECASGWTGQIHSEEINECDADPCMNGALCHESSIPGNLYICDALLYRSICHQHITPESYSISLAETTQCA
jgi:hypothetical protein